MTLTVSLEENSRSLTNVRGYAIRKGSRRALCCGGSNRRFRKANRLPRDNLTSPRFCFLKEATSASGGASQNAESDTDLHNARATAQTHITRETTRNFDVALHGAVKSSVESMAVLHSAVCDCVGALRDGNVGAVDMILAMKSCALDSAARYRPPLDQSRMSNVNTLMDQIVKWAIAEYYRTVP